MPKASFDMSRESENRLRSRLTYGQTKSEYYRYCLETVLACDEIIGAELPPFEYDERKEYIKEAVREKRERES